jgi:hypothetical protein
MVMKAILIGLLVIGAVVMMETDVSAACRRCGPGANYCCCSISSPEEREKLLEEVKKHGKQVLIIGHADDSMSPKRLKEREMLIKDGLPPEIIGELILEGPTPRMSMRKGQEVMVERTGKSHDHLPPLSQ